jgi:hypothetical protein
VAARFAPAELMDRRCRRNLEFVKRDYTHSYLKMERYHNEHR